MIKKILTASLVLAVSFIFVGGCKKEAPQKVEEPQAVPEAQPAPMTEPAPIAGSESGEVLFKKHCAVCHPDGGNIVKPEMTLHNASLKTHKISTPADIVKIIRNPKPGMTKFDETVISDKEAAEIAEYVLKNY